MDMDRTVMITDAGSGLGRGLSIQLARDGCTVLAADKKMEEKSPRARHGGGANC